MKSNFSLAPVHKAFFSSSHSAYIIVNLKELLASCKHFESCCKSMHAFFKRSAYFHCLNRDYHVDSACNLTVDGKFKITRDLTLGLVCGFKT